MGSSVTVTNTQQSVVGLSTELNDINASSATSECSRELGYNNLSDNFMISLITCYYYKFKGGQWPKGFVQLPEAIRVFLSSIPPVASLRPYQDSVRTLSEVCQVKRFPWHSGVLVDAFLLRIHNLQCVCVCSDSLRSDQLY